MLLKALKGIWRWLDTHTYNQKLIDSKPDRIRLMRTVPFIFMHIACIGIFWVGVSPVAIGVLLFTYAIRVFALTAFFHRYFAHRAFKTNRLWQFVFAFVGTSAAQRGPLWWASHHRQHHRMSDQEGDTHSPVQNSFLWSHMLWFFANKNYPTYFERIGDWIRFPELKWLNRFDVIPPVVLALSLFGLGQYLAHAAPGLNTSGWQLLVWGFFVSTVLVYHVTFCINSLAHRMGTRRFKTTDDSRNNGLLALFAFGEGWHNNHHHYPASASQGFYWWEVDITYYILKLMSFLGMVRALKPVPKEILENH